ncbi:MAG: hypothetical protein K2X49_07175 [Acetobacteraceae bacterium]|nr:hypothetical protein [Acetobacteraceae bacterium]
MDNSSEGGMATRDALIEVACSVGALTNAVQSVIKSVEALKLGTMAPLERTNEAAAELDAALAQAKKTADASINAVVHVLRALGEKPPHER